MIKQNIIVYNCKKKLKELLTTTDPCSNINSMDDEIHTYTTCELCSNK